MKVDTGGGRSYSFLSLRCSDAARLFGMVAFPTAVTEHGGKDTYHRLPAYRRVASGPIYL